MKLVELLDSSEVILPGVYNRARVDDYMVESFNVRPMVGVHTLMVTAALRSVNDRYKVVVQFNGHVVGEKVTEENHVTVRCSCPSMRFFFGGANKRQKVLFGRMFKRYIPVPDYMLQRARPLPKNPNGIPGVCKHVGTVVKMMKYQGYMD